jgi:phospholipid-binding lipoprotein MlaA
LPFLGPSTVRDGIAWPVNYQYLTVYPHIDPVRTRYEIYALNIVSKRADYLRFQNVLQQATFDKYVFMRDAYLQRRAYQIERNEQLGDPYLVKNTLEKGSA